MTIKTNFSCQMLSFKILDDKGDYCNQFMPIFHMVIFSIDCCFVSQDVTTWIMHWIKLNMECLMSYNDHQFFVVIKLTCFFFKGANQFRPLQRTQ